jgi:biopolymer transport protein ExbD
MKLARPRSAAGAISLVSMIDVLMIMLVFFMVTSTYLDLRMIPVAEPGAESGAEGRAAVPGAAPLVIRLGADDLPRVRGQALTLAQLTLVLRDRLAADPGLAVVVLPSGQADAQALVSLLDTATLAGALNVRLLRLEAVP